MKQGFIKVAAATPDIRVADVPFNTKQICSAIEEAQNNQAKIVVFPELCVTGYTCGDLFTQDVLLQAAKQALLEITEFTREKDMLVFVGVPLVGKYCCRCWTSTSVLCSLILPFPLSQMQPSAAASSRYSGYR